jgi:NADP-dependent 3-hydroxy acid dehydrogenase YdfG
MPRAIEDSVVVVTGASSGIGRATAGEFAGRGATVVPAARRAQALDEAARECAERGGHAAAVPTDVTAAAAVEALARYAILTNAEVIVSRRQKPGDPTHGKTINPGSR